MLVNYKCGKSLRNKNIVRKIIESIPASEKDLIVEIGPGQGALTSELKKTNANIIAYELAIAVNSANIFGNSVSMFSSENWQVPTFL